MAKVAPAENALARNARGDAGVIGPQLRASREEAGISVRELARRTGLSPSLISQVENGKVLPSLATLFKLTNELGTRVNTMIFGEHRAPTQAVEAEVSHMPVAVRRVVKRGEGDHIILNSGVNWERLTPAADMEADFLHVTYEPGGSSCEAKEFIRHNGREYGHILSGVLKVTIGFEEHVLRQGDSISFDSTLPHRLETVGDKPVHAIWFVTGRNGRG